MTLHRRWSGGRWIFELEANPRWLYKAGGIRKPGRRLRAWLELEASP